MNAAAEIAAGLETAARNGARPRQKRFLSGWTARFPESLPEVETHLAEVRAMKILVAEDDAISRMPLAENAAAGRL